MSHSNPLRKRSPASHRGEGGFSLVELMFTLIILSIGLMAVAGMIPMATHQVVASRSVSNAMTAGQSRLEELRGCEYNHTDLTPGTHQDVSGRYTRVWQVQNDVPVAGSKRIDLTVSWSTSSGLESARMSTFITR